MFSFQAGLQQSRFSLAQAQSYSNEEAKAPLSHDGGTRSLAPLGTHRKLPRDPITSSIAYVCSHPIGFIDLRQRIAVRIGFPANLLQILNQLFASRINQQSMLTRMITQHGVHAVNSVLDRGDWHSARGCWRGLQRITPKPIHAKSAARLLPLCASRWSTRSAFD
jgi:hypothetical protein